MDDVTNKVARQYTDYAYPEPFADIQAAMDKGAIQLGDPGLYTPMLWPEGAPKPNLDILVAGCGTVQAAMLAFTNRNASVMGIDLSEASLAHQRYLKERHGLDNLQLFQGDLREVGGLGKKFDLVVSTGVLHHLPDPGVGLKALASVLAPHGALVCMVYGAVPRAGVYLMQEAFRRLDVKQDAAGVAFVREVLAQLPEDHPVRAYLKTAPDLAHDSGIVDTFLHPQDRAYTVPQVLDWIEASGLAFQGWMENAQYFPGPDTPTALRPFVGGLAERELWTVMENLRGSLAKHGFVARLPGRERRVDFTGDAWLGYRPQQMVATYIVSPPDMEKGTPARLRRLNAEFQISPAEAILYAWSKGERTIARMLEEEAFAGHPKADRERFAQGFFSRMWRQGHLMFST